jgi:hypothetical protein
MDESLAWPVSLHANHTKVTTRSPRNAKFLVSVKPEPMTLTGGGAGGQQQWNESAFKVEVSNHSIDFTVGSQCFDGGTMRRYRDAKVTP